MNLEGKRFLSTTEVAEMLGVTTRTVQRWFRRGALPGLQQLPRGRWRVSVDALKKRNDTSDADDMSDTDR